MPTVSPSLAGLDARDRRLVKAWCALAELLLPHLADNGDDINAYRNAGSAAYTSMSAHARCRCQQWLRRWQVVQRSEVTE